jgi:hypothetical protein
VTHAHARDARLSTPSVDLCACGAVRPLGAGAWLSPTAWEPPPVPQLAPRPARSTTPLPLLAREELCAERQLRPEPGPGVRRIQEEPSEEVTLAGDGETKETHHDDAQ